MLLRRACTSPLNDARRDRPRKMTIIRADRAYSHAGTQTKTQTQTCHAYVYDKRQIPTP